MSTTPTLKRYTILRHSSNRQKAAAATAAQMDADSASISCSSSISESSSGIQKDFGDNTSKKSSGKKSSSTYRIANTPKYVMAGLVDLVSRKRSPSATRRAEQQQRKGSEPVAHVNPLPPKGRSPSCVTASSGVEWPPLPSPRASLPNVLPKTTPADPVPSSSKPPVSPAQYRRAPLQNPVSPIVRVQYPAAAEFNGLSGTR
ncbi:hypothetical protein L596_006474 [Steinernema carpocapsae]|uniref:Uncharacterized protein n=1 Tax=Steinernema carpocapsae TaxID=34508 RepID=A0A4U8V259_STECR|nr:hypothetical protein L596_006474 [Steinernema carpocapsae]